MAAEVTFRDVLNYVANSRLNFSIYQTPFSAQLSLKKSFAKHFNEDKAEFKRKESEVETVTWAEEADELRTRLEQTVKDNRKLKELISEKDRVIENLEDTLKNEKKKTKQDGQKNERRIAEGIKIKIKDEVIEDDDNKHDISNVPTANMYDTLAQLGDAAVPVSSTLVAILAVCVLAPLCYEIHHLFHYCRGSSCGILPVRLSAGGVQMKNPQ